MSSDKIGNMQFGVISHYVKLLSFENINIDYQEFGATPKLDVSVDIEVVSDVLAPSTYAVSLNFSTEANSQDKKHFKLRLIYTGIFRISGLPESSLQAMLFVECPKVIFPFARRILYETTRDGGHEPLSIDPINFFDQFIESHKRDAASG